MDRFKIKKCKECGQEYRQYNSLVKYCSRPCADKNAKPKEFKPKTPIKKVSDKRKKLLPVYDKIRIEVLSEAKFKCFVDGCKNVATTCEHQKGRKGFADEWAIENNIPLLIDKRFLKPCCNFHNTEFENNTDLSMEYQLSKLHDGKKIDKRN